MTRRPLAAAVAIAAIALTGGCKKPEDEFAPAVGPKVYAFEGKVESKYAGVWKSSDGNATMDLGQDGSLKIETIAHSVAGKSVTHIVGKWLVSTDSLVLRYVVGSQSPVVVKYSALLSGKTLTLTQPGGRLKTIYKKG